MAFVMLNRFLDLSDAMDEPDSSAAVIENADFADTDIPYDFTIPDRPYANEAQREEVSREHSCWACRPCQARTSASTSAALTSPVFLLLYPAYSVRHLPTVMPR